MRVYKPGFISEEERLELLSMPNTNRKILIKDAGGVISSIFERINKISNIKPHKEAYARLEHKTDGHRWHKDTGSSNHMMWCSFGCSILLSNPNEFDGGEFYYRDGKSDQEVRSLVMHSSDVEHLVTKHSGKRVVLLFFF